MSKNYTKEHYAINKHRKGIVFNQGILQGSIALVLLQIMCKVQNTV